MGLGLGVARIDMAALVLVILGGLGFGFAPDIDMAAVFLVYLVGLGIVGLGTVFGIGADMDGFLFIVGVVGTVLVVCVVWLLVLLTETCIWTEVEMVLGLAFEMALGGKGSLSLGGGRPPGEGMGALCLVNLVGVRGSCRLAATIVGPFCFF